MNHRVLYRFALLACLLLQAAGAAHANLADLLNGLGAASSQGATLPSGQAETAQALKQALAKGTQAAIAQLGKEGGYLNNLNVKIPMPGNLAKVEKTLRKLGQDKVADEFVATLNHAAEKAAPEAAAVFADAIRAMSIEDATAILKGPDDAATQYFRKHSATRLAERFLPIVQGATDQAGVTAAYKKLMGKAGSLAKMLGGSSKDLDAYVTDKALDGLFKMVAAEEKNIRENPLARTTDLLKKVFGNILQ